MKYKSLLILLQSIIPAATSEWNYECKTGSSPWPSFEAPWLKTGTVEFLNLDNNSFRALHSSLDTG